MTASIGIPLRAGAGLDGRELDTSGSFEPRGLTRADLMTAAQVAELLSVPVSTVRDWGRRGVLPRIKLGRHVRFVRVQVEEAVLRAGRDQADAGT